MYNAQRTVTCNTVVIGNVASPTKCPPRQYSLVNIVPRQYSLVNIVPRHYSLVNIVPRHYSLVNIALPRVLFTSE